MSKKFVVIVVLLVAVIGGLALHLLFIEEETGTLPQNELPTEPWVENDILGNKVMEAGDAWRGDGGPVYTIYEDTSEDYPRTIAMYEYPALPPSMREYTLVDTGEVDKDGVIRGIDPLWDPTISGELEAGGIPWKWGLETRPNRLPIYSVDNYYLIQWRTFYEWYYPDVEAGKKVDVYGEKVRISVGGHALDAIMVVSVEPEGGVFLV